MPMQTKCDILIFPEHDTTDYSMLEGETKAPETSDLCPRPILQLALNDVSTSGAAPVVVMKAGDLKFAVSMADLQAAVKSFEATLKNK